VKVVEFIGRPEHTPIKLFGYQDMTTTLPPVETIHANYFGRGHKLIATSDREVVSSFTILDKRKTELNTQINGEVVFEAKTCSVIKN
jgi:hypothetical protein